MAVTRYPPGLVSHLVSDLARPDARCFFSLGNFDLVASKTKDFKVIKWTAPFPFTISKVYATSQEVVVATAITINVEVAGGTPQIVTDIALAAVTAGAGSCQDLTMAAPNVAVAAGEVIEVSYGSGAGDTAADVNVHMLVVPNYA